MTGLLSFATLSGRRLRVGRRLAKLACPLQQSRYLLGGALKVYSTKWCTDCMLAKQFLKQRGVAFEDVLLESNPAAKSRIIERLGRLAKVPVIEINNRMFSLNPFDPNRLAAELSVDAAPLSEDAN
ncbi:MAG: hypothetical protein CFK52_12820 [Chloracidobacterium sp. CP2_5A]|nr:MAG: hypothetical protein CFK52_12820 [Chloracidobacterium sp. CP2_5A]